MKGQYRERGEKSPKGGQTPEGKKQIRQVPREKRGPGREQSENRKESALKSGPEERPTYAG